MYLNECTLFGYVKCDLQKSFKDLFMLLLGDRVRPESISIYVLYECPVTHNCQN